MGSTGTAMVVGIDTPIVEPTCGHHMKLSKMMNVFGCVSLAIKRRGQMRLSHKKYEKAENFPSNYDGKPPTLVWECPKCGSGTEPEPLERAEARFSVGLAQIYKWSIDADGERRTRHGIVSILPPRVGDKAECGKCSHVFALKERK